MNVYVDDVWTKYDTDKNGVLDYQEAFKYIGELIKELQIKPQGKERVHDWHDVQIDKIFRAVDVDNSLTVTKSELLRYLRVEVCGLV